MSLVKSYFDYVNEPEKSLRELVDRRSGTQAVCGYLAAALSWVLFFNIGDGLSAPAFLLKLAIVLVAELTAGCLLASFAGFILDMQRIETSPVKLFVLIGSAGFIKGLFIAFALISATFPFLHLGILMPLALALVFGLQLGYLIRSLKRIYNVSYLRSFLAWVLAVVPAVLCLVLLGIFMTWGLALLF